MWLIAAATTTTDRSVDAVVVADADAARRRKQANVWSRWYLWQECCYSTMVFAFVRFYRWNCRWEPVGSVVKADNDGEASDADIKTVAFTSTDAGGKLIFAGKKKMCIWKEEAVNETVRIRSGLIRCNKSQTKPQCGTILTWIASVPRI